MSQEEGVRPSQDGRGHRPWLSAHGPRSGLRTSRAAPALGPPSPRPPARSAKILRGPDPRLTRSAFHLFMLKFPLLNRKLSTSGVLTCYTVITEDSARDA